MKTERKSDDPVAKLTFEQALEKLENIVTDIEEGQVSLEESIEKYAEGTGLIRHCRTILEAAEKKIQLLAKTDSGLQQNGQLDDPEP